MKRISLVISFLLLLFFSCKKKKEPIETNEPPVFSFQGKINGSPTSLYSGTNDYFMSTDWSVDVNNVKQFIGQLGKRTNSLSSNSLRLVIKDYRLLNLAPTTIDSSISLKYYSYCSPLGTPNSYSVTFIPNFIGGTPQTFNWTFHDGVSSAANPTHVYTGPGKFNVCLNIASTASCNSGICHNVTIGTIGNGVESGFAASTPTGNVISFTAQPVQGSPPYSYQWNFGDANTSTVANPTHTYATNGVYTVSLTVTDSKNSTSTYENNVNTQSPGSCLTKFSYLKTGVSNPYDLGNIILEWTDQNGTVYSTYNSSQPISSGFKITSVEEYLVNESGQKTKKIKASFNCTLYSGSNSIILDEGEIVFAVAYP